MADEVIARPNLQLDAFCFETVTIWSPSRIQPPLRETPGIRSVASSVLVLSSKGQWQSYTQTKTRKRSWAHQKSSGVSTFSCLFLLWTHDTKSQENKNRGKERRKSFLTPTSTLHRLPLSCVTFSCLASWRLYAGQKGGRKLERTDSVNQSKSESRSEGGALSQPRKRCL